MRLILLVFLLFTSTLSFAQDFPPINVNNVEIVRDKWGVPHIFGKTDAEVAYGLAWANAEDAYSEMQELLILGKGLMGRYQGESGAGVDFFRHTIQAESVVAEKIKTMPEDFLKYLDGFVQGANAYAKKHPEDVKLKGMFPITSEDVLTSYVVAMSAMTDASGAMERIYGGKLDNEPVMGLGSNAYAASSTKTEDGNTYLCINPHLEMNGNFSFYEAHLSSEEGLNVHGALFPGGTSVFMGSNDNLGWGMTWNHFDKGDTYKLKMHPKKKLYYEYDGEWLKLEKKKIWLKVKVGKITVPVPKTSYMSVIGPVLKSKKGKDFFAFRYPAFMDASAPLQWYKMDKAKSFEEFKSALDILGVGLFNIVYADKDDNIFYISSGQVPLRSQAIAKAKLLDGSKSEFVWQRIRTVSELPQLENPSSGYVYNTNNSPFLCSATEDNPDKGVFPEHVDERPGQNNRAMILSDYLAKENQLNFDEFQAIKFSNAYHTETYLYKNLSSISNIDLEKNPDVKDMLDLFKGWDHVADSNDVSAAIVMVTIDKLFRKKGYGDTQFIKGFEASEADFLAALRSAKAWFIEHYGTIEVPLGKIFKAKRGNNTITSPGFPDALAANYGKEKNGKYYLQYGDTYTQFVKFNKEGVSELRTLVPFGSSYNADSPHYFDQAPLFRDQVTKEMSLDKMKIYNEAVSIYHPE